MDTVLGHFQVIFPSCSSLICIFAFSYLMRKCDVSPLTLEKGQEYWALPRPKAPSSRMQLVLVTLDRWLKNWDLLASLMLLFLLILTSQMLSFVLLNSLVLGIVNVCPWILLANLRRIPRDQRNLDDTLESWMSFGPPLLCAYSFYSTTLLFSSLALPAETQSVGEKLFYFKEILQQSTDKTTIPILICCVSAVALIYASLTFFIIHCSLKSTHKVGMRTRSDSWTVSLYRPESEASLPRALLTSMTLALSSLLFSTGAIIFRLPLIIEYLVR